jgi:hypothetical protein
MALLENKSKGKWIKIQGLVRMLSSYGGRFVNKNGSANVEKRGCLLYSGITR